MHIVTIHASKISEDLYFFDGDICTYDNRQEPLATVTAVYVFEGTLVDLRAFRGKPTVSLFRALKKYLAEQGAARVEWRRDNTDVERAKAYSLITGKAVAPLFNLV